MIPNLQRVLPDEDYGFQIRFERGNPADFFATTAAQGKVRAERKGWLESAPQVYAALLPSGEPLLNETLALAAGWNGFVPQPGRTPWENLLALGEFWESIFYCCNLMWKGRFDCKEAVFVSHRRGGSRTRWANRWISFMRRCPD